MRSYVLAAAVMLIACLVSPIDGAIITIDNFGDSPGYGFNVSSAGTTDLFGVVSSPTNVFVGFVGDGLGQRDISVFQNSSTMAWNVSVNQAVPGFGASNPIQTGVPAIITITDSVSSGFVDITSSNTNTGILLNDVISAAKTPPSNIVLTVNTVGGALQVGFPLLPGGTTDPQNYFIPFTVLSVLSGAPDLAKVTSVVLTMNDIQPKELDINAIYATTLNDPNIVNNPNEPLTIVGPEPTSVLAWGGLSLAGLAFARFKRRKLIRAA